MTYRKTSESVQMNQTPGLYVGLTSI